MEGNSFQKRIDLEASNMSTIISDKKIQVLQLGGHDLGYTRKVYLFITLSS
jgi:hypothetical protein